VPEAEPAECVVVAGGADSPDGDDASLPVTALAELRRIVTIAAVRFASVGRARVACQEILRVVAGLTRDFGAVTLEARRAHVAGLARRRPRARLGPVSLPEVPRVTRRRGASPLRGYRTSGCSSRHGSDNARHRSNVTARATLSRMTAGARHGAGVRQRSVPLPEVARVTRWFGTCQQRAGSAARAGSRQRRNGARRHSNVAARTALPRMTSRARRCGLLRKPAMRA